MTYFLQILLVLIWILRLKQLRVTQPLIWESYWMEIRYRKLKIVNMHLNSC